MWKTPGLDDNVQNLVVEMILRRDIIVPDLAAKVFSTLGHLGYHNLKYWLQLENQLHQRREHDYPLEAQRPTPNFEFDNVARDYAANLNIQ